MKSPPAVRNCDLAWSLADIVAGYLSATERTAVYLEIGVGQFWESITRLLSAAVREEVAVPAKLLAALSRWLDGYIGNVDEPSARAHLEILYRRVGVTGPTTSVLSVLPVAAIAHANHGLLID